MSIVYSRKLQEYKRKLYRFPNSNIYRYKVNKYTYYLQQGGGGDDDEIEELPSAENDADAQLEEDVIKELSEKIEDVQDKEEEEVNEIEKEIAKKMEEEDKRMIEDDKKEMNQYIDQDEVSNHEIDKLARDAGIDENLDISEDNERDMETEVVCRMDEKCGKIIQKCDDLKENYENLQNIYDSSKKIVSDYIKSMKEILPKKQ